MIKKLIGWILTATPFIGIFLYVAINDSITAACAVYGVSAVLIGMIIVGAKWTSD